jgi:acetyl esterase/lipase
MASEQSSELTTLYRNWAAAQAAQPNMPMDVMRRMFDHWGDVTAEPCQVDYIEVDVDSVQAMWVSPKAATVGKVLLCAHGGGYVAGSMYTHRKLHGHIAKAVGCRALSVNYRLAPEFTHPASVDDMVRVYRWLVSHEGIDPNDIAILGDSAGGSLALTTVAALKRLSVPLPAAIVSMSPWAGSDTSGDSYEFNAANDVLVTRGMSVAIGKLFLGAGGDPQDPLANPLRIDYAGFPPLYIQVGSYEAVLSDSTRIAAAAKAAGVAVRIDEFPEMQHCFELLAGSAPEADEAVRRIAAWLRPLFGIQR